MPEIISRLWWLIPALALVFAGLKNINQGTIGVVTMFGKYRRIIRPGLRFLIPFFEQIFKRISIQNRSIEMEFQAVTADQANVYFKNMLLYAVQNDSEETIKKVAFKFIIERELMQALSRTIEGTIHQATIRNLKFEAGNSGICKRADRPIVGRMGIPFAGFADQ
jgi:regulator of protease activity HflC (stomatin/prohibitin superfamily)